MQIRERISRQSIKLNIKLCKYLENKDEQVMSLSEDKLRKCW